MRIIICLALLFSSVNSVFSQTSLDQIRLNYISAVSDKNTCKKMIEELELKTNDAIYLGYLGGFQAIWANHVGNPFSKLKTFNKGKANIEKAIKQDPNSPELRYIRLSIQKNVPGILGYNDMVDKDTEFLKLHKAQINSPSVLKNVDSLLKP